MIIEKQMLNDLRAEINRIHGVLVDLTKGQNQILNKITILEERDKAIIEDVNYLHREAGFTTM